MSAALALLVFLLLTTTWLLLPFLPALFELRAKRDAAPLHIVQDHDGDVRYFARRFHAYVQKQWGDALADCGRDGVSREGALADGGRYVVTPGGPLAALGEEEWREGITRKIILSCKDVRLPRGMAYLSDIYARGDVHGGDKAVYRAILSERDVRLGAGNMLLRWLHAEGAVKVAAQGVLYGRVSAERSIALAEGCRFERLHAPRIAFGMVTDRPVAWPPGRLVGMDLWHTAELHGRRWLVARGLNIPARSHIKGNVVVYGRLRIGAGCHIEGSVKSRYGLYTGPQVQIDGSVVSDHRVYLGEDCRVHGPVLAKRRVTIATGCRIGHPHRPTTVSAPEIIVASGTLAYGTVWARKEGKVLA